MNEGSPHWIVERGEGREAGWMRLRIFLGGLWGFGDEVVPQEEKSIFIKERGCHFF